MHQLCSGPSRPGLAPGVNGAPKHPLPPKKCLKIGIKFLGDPLPLVTGLAVLRWNNVNLLNEFDVRGT